jgi:hypothetical protein
VLPGAAHRDYLLAALKEDGAMLVTGLADFVRGCRPQAAKD